MLRSILVSPVLGLLVVASLGGCASSPSTPNAVRGQAQLDPHPNPALYAGKDRIWLGYRSGLTQLPGHQPVMDTPTVMDTPN